MKIDVSLSLGFTDKDGKPESGINVSLSIPAGEMTPANPVKFIAVQTDPEGKETKNGGKILEVAVGDKSHIYVAVAPPKYLLEKANIEKTVRALDVKVQEGKYNSEKGEFDEVKAPG